MKELYPKICDQMLFFTSFLYKILNILHWAHDVDENFCQLAAASM